MLVADLYRALVFILSWLPIYMNSAHVIGRGGYMKIKQTQLVTRSWRYRQLLTNRIEQPQRYLDVLHLIDGVDC